MRTENFMEVGGSGWSLGASSLKVVEGAGDRGSDDNEEGAWLRWLIHGWAHGQSDPSSGN